MDKSHPKPANIDEYISSFPSDIQEILQKIRAIVHAEAPQAEEVISYDMPAFKLNGKVLVYFSAFEKHIGFYPPPVENPVFKQDFMGYKTGKGSIQFPLNKPMPFSLIIKIVKYRLAINLLKTAAKEK